MSFVNLDQSIERERRMEQLMIRMSSLPEEDFDKISKMLKAQSQIDNIVDSNSSALGGGDSVARQMQNTMAKSGETITSNLTQLLGFVPSSNDMTELKSMNERFGDGFSSTMKTISASIGSVGGGIGKLLESLDTGVTEGIQQVANTAYKTLADLKQQTTDAIADILPPADSIIPQSTLSSLGEGLSGLLSGAGDLAGGLTTAIQEQVNQGAKEVSGFLDDISKDIEKDVKEFIDSTVTSSQFDELKNLTSSILGTPPSPPVPVNENGEDFPSVPMMPGSDLNSAPARYEYSP